MNIRKVLAGIAVLGGLAAGSLTLATPAMAEEGNGIKEPGEFIVWRGRFSDNAGFYDFATDKPSYGTLLFHFVNIRVDNNISSVWNRSSVNQVHAFTDANYTGAPVLFNPGASVDLSKSPYTAFDNAISSHHF
jgi:hypothetical protein